MEQNMKFEMLFMSTIAATALCAPAGCSPQQDGRQPSAKADVSETTIPDENAGSPLIPLDPEGNLQDWLKSAQSGEAATEAAEIEEIKEIVEEEKEAIEEADEAKQTTEPAKEQAPAPAEK